VKYDIVVSAELVDIHLLLVQVREDSTIELVGDTGLAQRLAHSNPA